MTVSFTGYTGCCGSDIVYWFSSNPDTPAGGSASYVQDTFADGRPKTDRYGYPVWKIDPKTGQYVMKENPSTHAELFEEKLQKQIKQYKNDRLFTCILNQTQYDDFNNGWAKVLKRNGFQFVRRFRNGNHGGTYYLYLFALVVNNDEKHKTDITAPPKGWEEFEGPPHVDPIVAKIKRVVKRVRAPRTGGAVEAVVV